MTRVILLAAIVGVASACGSSSQPAQTRPSDSAAQPGRGASPTTPQWPAASSLNQSALAAVPSQTADQIRQSPVPVLVPADPAMLAPSRVTLGPQQYTFASTVPGLTVSVQASASPATGRAGGQGNLSTPLPRVPAGERQVFITENEGIRVASWMENGIAYSADVECATRTDTRCQNNEYLLTLVRTLTFVGGRPQ